VLECEARCRIRALVNPVSSSFLYTAAMLMIRIGKLLVQVIMAVAGVAGDEAIFGSPDAETFRAAS
jgi:hypothetical protein